MQQLTDQIGSRNQRVVGREFPFTTVPAPRGESATTHSAAMQSRAPFDAVAVGSERNRRDLDNEKVQLISPAFELGEQLLYAGTPIGITSTTEGAEGTTSRRTDAAAITASSVGKGSTSLQVERSRYGDAPPPRPTRDEDLRNYDGNRSSWRHDRSPSSTPTQTICLSSAAAIERSGTHGVVDIKGLSGINHPLTVQHANFFSRATDAGLARSRHQTPLPHLAMSGIRSTFHSHRFRPKSVTLHSSSRRRSAATPAAPSRGRTATPPRAPRHSRWRSMAPRRQIQTARVQLPAWTFAMAATRASDGNHTDTAILWGSYSAKLTVNDIRARTGPRRMRSR